MVVIGVAFPGKAFALSPALGRWSGGGSGGEIQFAVSRVDGTLVVSNVVVSCSAAAGAAAEAGPPDSDEEAIERSGRIYSYSYPAALSGKLGSKSGTVTANAAVADLSLTSAEPGLCGSAGLRNVRVAPSGARAIRDGTYSITGPLWTQGTATVYGEGALIQYSASWATPEGGGEDNPEACAEGEATAFLPGTYTALSDAGGSFSSYAVDGFGGMVGTVSLAGRFTGSTSAVGTYSATFSDGDALDCAGVGPFAMKLVQAAPALDPVRAPEPAPPNPNPPGEVDCAMRFQLQHGTTNEDSEPINKPHRITVAEALAGLDLMKSRVTGGLRRASANAFAGTQKWVASRPPHGVSATGNVKRVWFMFEKKKWRLDTENLRCTNLTS